MSQLPRRPIIQLYQIVSGRRFLTRLDELNRTQQLNRSELLALQQKKLRRLLTYADQYVPYYQRLFKQANFRPDDVLDDPGNLCKLPILTKAIIHENLDDMMTTEGKRRAGLSRLSTGGSTGHPLTFMQDSNFRDYVTADIHRHLGWAGWELGQIHAYIWGASFEVAASQAIRTRLMNWVLNRFVSNAYVLSDESMSAFVTQIRRRRPRILFGYPSSLYRFAEFVHERCLDDVKFDAIFSSAEVLYPAQRQFIEEILDGKMFNRYGTRELGGISCECEAHTALHTSVENVYVEILRDLDSNDFAQAGEPGHIIVTNLNNFGFPFIRYSIEDMGAWSTIDHCPCGLESPLMDLVQGRRIDMFNTKDGRTVWGGFASPLFAMEGIKQFQVVQKSLDLIVVRIVKDGDLKQSQLDTIERTVKIALGDNVEVKFEFPNEIPVLDSGKYRYTISEISKQLPPPPISR
ncbi:MAG: phenylacetate--CoA ligase family protein [Aestuariibacter sp.]|nr:phenylacetate--CoA ligase family protein [Aestuariibacter sp.]